MARTRNNLSPEELEHFDAALTETNGNRKMAAKVLNTSIPRLQRYIEREEFLRSKWGEAEKKEIADPEVHRPITISKEQALAIATAKEDGTLQKGFKALGYEDADRDFLQKVANLSSVPALNMLDLTIGGMVKSFTDLLLIKEKLKEKLLDVVENPGNYEVEMPNGTIAQLPHKVMVDLVDRITAISKEMRSMNTAAEQGQIVRAKIREIERHEAEAKKEGKKLPGFPVGTKNVTLVQNNYGSKEKPANE